jgi:hypothetical protein
MITLYVARNACKQVPIFILHTAKHIVIAGAYLNGSGINLKRVLNSGWQNKKHPSSRMLFYF